MIKIHLEGKTFPAWAVSFWFRFLHMERRAWDLREFDARAD